jgi:hypothetical protein
MAFAARGIVAEPPSASEAKREGDGADSPTRTKKAPKFIFGAFFVKRLAQIINVIIC